VANQSARTVGQIIDKAIEENRPSEAILYTFSAAFVVLGLFIFFVVTYQNNYITSLGGSISSVLFVPAVLLAERVRNRNMALRMLEIALLNARTADEAATALRQFFSNVFNISLSQKSTVADEPVNGEGKTPGTPQPLPRNGEGEVIVEPPPTVVSGGQH
jgi:hypothetical protein